MCVCSKHRQLWHAIRKIESTTTGIDSDPKATGSNVSGYLLSYCNIQLVGPDRFKNADLDFTSDFVRGRIRERMKDFSTQEHIQIVVDHLNGEQTDRGGLHLQEIVLLNLIPLR